MCRFLLVKSKEKRDMQDLLEDFAVMAQESRTVDGDRQGDGWGVAWLDEKGWQSIKSLSPIWEEMKRFSEVPKTRAFAVHARSATYEKTIGEIEFNQPFVNGEFSFVFNGHLRGVRLRKPTEGKIGSQKYWSLIMEEMKNTSPEDALRNVFQLVEKNTKETIGINIGMISSEGVLAVSDFSSDGDYFRLRGYEDENIAIVCSEEIGDFEFERLPKGSVLHYN